MVTFHTIRRKYDYYLRFLLARTLQSGESQKSIITKLFL